MKSKFVLCLLAFLCSVLLSAEDRRVVIIGGGPAGLATALEARAHGYPVTVVEKRDGYSRPQWVFLFGPSLKLLEKWNVRTPQMHVIDLGGGNAMGFISIKHLEEQLEMRVRESGVEKIQGEFKAFGSNHTTIIVTPGKKERVLSHDILVGADGAHSNVREALGVEKSCFGTAMGVTAILASGNTDSAAEVDFSPIIKKRDGFLRRFKTPQASVVFAQFPERASKSDLQKATAEQGWIKEARVIGESGTRVLEDIAILLQQAHRFSDEKKAAVLVGDAAATASFFQGKGANTALRAAEIAGRFFKEMQTQPQTAFQNFNQAMKETTDALIEDSAFLFESQPSAEE